MKTIDVNISTPTIVDTHAQLCSQVGSLTGKKFFKVEARMAWQGGQEGFEKDKLAITSGEKSGFILNRSPRRLLCKDYLVAGVIITKDIDDTIGLAINPKDDGNCDLFLPLEDNAMSALGKTTVDAIKEAIKGEKDHFFLDAAALTKVINDAMRKEIALLEAHMTACQKMVTTLKGDIAANEQKAKDASDRWIKSAIPTEPTMGDSKIVMTVTKNEE